jgi:hypothetical protein
VEELIIQASREDFAPQELDSLADALGDASADPSVSIGIKVQDNSGVLPPEIVHVFLPWLEGYVAGKMVDATLKWLREMWKRRKRRKRRRPVVADVYIDEELVTRVICDWPDGEPRPYDGEVWPMGVYVGPPRWRSGPRKDEQQGS